MVPKLMKSKNYTQSRIILLGHRILLRIRRLAGVLREYRIILRSGLFYFTFYLKENPDVAMSGMNPLFHYILWGCKGGCAPNPLFDSEWYLRTYPDVINMGSNPLFHYIKHGEKEGRDPGPRFSTNRYLKRNPDIRETGMSPLLHYLKHGSLENRSIN